MSNFEIVSESFANKYKNKKPNWGFNGLGYVVFKRTYARVVDPTDRRLLSPSEIEEYRYKNLPTDTEEWYETIRRCINGAQKLGAAYTKDEAEELFDHMFNFRCMFSGRGLWQLGTSTVEKLGVDSLLNCWVKKISNIDDFCFVFMESMLGGGVGCVITKEYTQELPRVKKDVTVSHKNTKDADYIVPDSKEGWVELWRKTLEAHLVTGKSFTYSTICIRNNGEPIKTFGGIAPGPKPLIDGITLLNTLLKQRENKKLRTEDVADIICIGGQIVKSGGVRRTAIILMGDVDDAAYLQLKRWDLGDIPNYRSNSNNSLICNKYNHLSDRFWDGYNGNGEPYGLINIKNAQKFGRYKESEFDGFDLVDPSIIGFNPCAEADLADGECCNLAELAINNINSKEQMSSCAYLLYKTQKAIALGKYLFEETNEIVHKNLRLGMGITGVCQRLDVIDEWSDYTYKKLRKLDKEYSKKLGVNQSIRLTVIKPSGTLSLLTGSTPGAHPGYSKHHIRRIRFSANDKLVPALKEAGYKVEPEISFDGRENHDTFVVEFPACFDAATKVSKDMSAVDQLDIVKRMQTYWADQAVSVTVYYKPEELPSIKDWLKDNYDQCVKSVSFLLHSNHGFKQSPLEEIDESKYNEMKSKIKPINIKNDIQKDIDSQECSSGACPIK